MSVCIDECMYVYVYIYIYREREREREREICSRARILEFVSGGTTRPAPLV